jgi:hypothetical protein
MIVLIREINVIFYPFLHNMERAFILDWKMWHMVFSNRCCVEGGGGGGQ